MPEWKIPGYIELRALGSGGFGTVVLARHDESGALVAVKYLRGELLADPGFAAMFRDEAAALASLDDPHVVRLYEYVESPAGAAIVMELIDGVSVRDILSRQGATSAEAALVVLQGSLLGLAAAHARGIVHRDYKPENVLVNGAGASKLTDFGIAARAGDRAIPAGTLAYAPPEQFGGGPASPAGDVYAATATFYECLTGHPPFTEQTTEALLAQHRSEPVPLDLVPGPLRPLVSAGMAKDPAGRPADAAVFVSKLRTAAADACGQDWEERGRQDLVGAALLLAALWPSGAAPAVQGIAVKHVNLPHSSRGSRQSRHLRHLQHKAHLRHLRRLRALMAVAAAAAVGVVVAVAVVTAGSSHPPSGGANLAPRKPPGPGTAYVFLALSGLIQPVDLSTNTIETPIKAGQGEGVIWAVSPDNKIVYILGSHPGTIVPVNVSTRRAGTPIFVGKYPSIMAIAPDGKSIYVSTGAGLITPVDLITRTPAAPLHIPGGIQAITIAPDGKSAYVINGGYDAITPVNLVTDNVGSRVPISGGADAVAFTPDSRTAYVVGTTSSGDTTDATVTPVNVATGALGSPIRLGKSDTFPAIAITPDGKTAYVAGTGDSGNRVVPINLATGGTSTPIPSGQGGQSIAITPNGKTAYVVNNLGIGTDSQLTPINLAAGRPEPSIKLSSDTAIAITIVPWPRAAPTSGGISHS